MFSFPLLTGQSNSQSYNQHVISLLALEQAQSPNWEVKLSLTISKLNDIAGGPWVGGQMGGITAIIMFPQDFLLYRAVTNSLPQVTLVTIL